MCTPDFISGLLLGEPICNALMTFELGKALQCEPIIFLLQLLIMVWFAYKCTEFGILNAEFRLGSKRTNLLKY